MLQDLLNSKNYMEIYIIARWAYKNNSPIFSDNVFDKYEDLLKNMFPDDEIFSRSYEDDNEPTEILNKYNISLQNQFTTNYVTRDSVLDNEPISQRPVRNKEEAYLWYKQFDGQIICHSLKIDGISTRTVLSKNTGLVQSSYSKGRSDTVTDFSLTVKKKLNQGSLRKINGSEGNNILVAAEGIITNEGVKVINDSLHTTYRNGRSAALGLLSTDIPEHLLKYLHLFAFSYSNITGSYSENLVNVESLNFQTVPRLVHTYHDEGFEHFSNWIDNITAELHKQAKALDIQADGIVARLDATNQYNSQAVNGLYSDGSIALKFNEFIAKTYSTVVEDISLEFKGSSSENYTTKITIKPVITDDNKKITKITGYNLSHIINKGIKKGTVIDVLYQSGCYPMLG